MLLFQQQQYEKYAALFNGTVNNALVLGVVILNICDYKVTNTIMGYHLAL
jgi:hypothetical protein